MANVVLFTNNVAQYLKSVNTPDYIGNPNAIIEPDVSLLTNVPLKYWKRVGNTVIEMTTQEKQAILDAELLLRKNAANTLNIQDMKAILTALVKVINVRLPANQKITIPEMVDALKNEIT